jgi:hypothetical protein
MSIIISAFKSFFSKGDVCEYPDMDVRGVTSAQASIIYSLTEIDR